MSSKTYIIPKSNSNLESNPDSSYPPKVETVDPNNVPKFVQDYINCPTKFFQQHNGFSKSKVEDGFRYTCIPQNMVNECSQYPNTTRLGTEYNKGQKVEVTDTKKYSIYGKSPVFEVGKYYCGLYMEGIGSISLPEMIGYECPSNDKEFVTLPKSINVKGIYPSLYSCVKIPVSLFSKTDR